MNLHIQVNILHFQCQSCSTSFPVSHSMKDGRSDSVLGVATVVWTCVVIYHLSLSTCMGGPAVGIIAIWEQLTVIPSFCLCKISSSTRHVFTRNDRQTWYKKLCVCCSSYRISLSACLKLFLGGLERPLRVNHYTLSQEN